MHAEFCGKGGHLCLAAVRGLTRLHKQQRQQCTICGGGSRSFTCLTGVPFVHATPTARTTVVVCRHRHCTGNSRSLALDVWLLVWCARCILVHSQLHCTLPDGRSSTAFHSLTDLLCTAIVCYIVPLNHTLICCTLPSCALQTLAIRYVLLQHCFS